MRLPLFSVLTAALFAAVSTACDYEGIGAMGGTGGAPPPIADECDKAADCLGGSCDSLTATYEICVDPPPAEITMCPPLTTSVCCSSADCDPGETCFDVPTCGGAQASNHQCVRDECDAATACPGGTACVPAGVAGHPTSRCLPAGCGSDADCAAAPNGRCALLRLGCCADEVSVACVYPGGCTSDGDCGADHCEVDPAGGTVCVAGAPLCPP